MAESWTQTDSRELAEEIGTAIGEGVTAAEDVEDDSLNAAEKREIQALVRRELPGHARRLAMLAATARLRHRDKGVGGG